MTDKKKSIKKTNAARVLDELNVAYELVQYEISPADLSAEAAAKAVGVEEKVMFKTLVAKGDKTGIVVACLPASKELSLKKLAEASGNKQVELVSPKDLFNLTGYIRGGCSPVGMKKKYPVYLDISSADYSEIYVNAGAQGILFKLASDVLIASVNGYYADLCRQ